MRDVVDGRCTQLAMQQALVDVALRALNIGFAYIMKE